jgi:hypothetical protein
VLPFRVHDRDKKITWLIVSFHPADNTYLAALEDDTHRDGELTILPASRLVGMKLIGFLEEEG